MPIPRYLSLALCNSYEGDDRMLPGVVGNALDIWPVPQLYDARADLYSRDFSEHDWAEVDVQLAPDVDVKRAASYLRRVAAWLDKHGDALLAHPRVVEELGGQRRAQHPPRQHLSARDNLREAVEQRRPARPRLPQT